MRVVIAFWLPSRYRVAASCPARSCAWVAVRSAGVGLGPGAAEDAVVRACDDADRVDRADGTVTVTFAGAASQTVRVSVDGTATTFPVRVTGGRAATAPEGDATTAARVGQDPDGGPSSARSDSRTPPVNSPGPGRCRRADRLGRARSSRSGTAVVGMRRARRTRHRA